MVKVLHYVAVMNRAGEETFLMNVFRTIERDKVSFDFLCSLPQAGEYDEEIAKLGGETIRFGQEQRCSLSTVDNLIKLYTFLKDKQVKYQAFHIHTQHAMDGCLNAIAAKMAGIKKVIVHSHSTSTLYYPALHHVFRPLLNALPIKKYACSIQAGQWLFGKRAKFEVIRNGIITKTFAYSAETRDRIRAEYGWSGKRIIGHVGSFTYAKNHSFLLRVFKHVQETDPTAMLVLVGAGEKEAKIREYISNNGLEECVMQMGSRSDTGELYQGMDLFLFPSLFEGLGIVLIEAQTAGLPCLISDVIPQSVDITSCVHRASLGSPAAEWAAMAKELLDAQTPRRDMSAEISAAGYDISTTASELQAYYLSD